MWGGVQLERGVCPQKQEDGGPGTQPPVSTPRWRWRRGPPCQHAQCQLSATLSCLTLPPWLLGSCRHWPAVWCFQAFNEIGGYQELQSRYPEAKPALTWEGNWTAPTECLEPRADAFHVFRDPVSGDIPWPGIAFGLSIISLYYWCTDQVTRLAALTALCRGQGSRGLCGHRRASLPALCGAQMLPHHAV